MERFLSGDFLKILESVPDELVKKGYITKDQLAVAKISRKNLGGDLSSILIKKRFVTGDKLRLFLKDVIKVPFGSIGDYEIDPAVVKTVPQSIVQKFRIFPLFRKNDVLVVAIVDVLDVFSIDQIKNEVKSRVLPVVVPEKEYNDAVQKHYRTAESSEISDDILEVISFGDILEESPGYEGLEEIASGTKIISAVNNIILGAYKEGASDIHIEPMQEQLKVRYRIDGLLEERATLPRDLHLPIVSRLKILGGMDIAEKRVPQDGRVNIKLAGEKLDLRLSTYPTMYGEKIVLRLLSKEGVLTLEDIGFDDKDRKKFVSIIEKPYGIFLVTGPTGSGKTTTLYAALQKVNSQERNIISIEDPIENEIPGVNQAQVNLKAGVTFASALRSILRQDPDIIMVGEIRDGETADIAVRSAMTGHLVFSTLHTNTAVGAIARLIDLGVEPFLISSALLGVMAQRLVRKICENCKYEIEIDKNQVERLFGREFRESKFYAGKGCKKCRMSGYSGRTGIFELVYIDDALKRIIAGSGSEDEIRKYVRESGVLSMRRAGAEKAAAGITTIDEVLRVTEEEG